MRITGIFVKKGDFTVSGQQVSPSQSATLRLLVIPCAIYTAWLLEIFLLEGSMQTFEHVDPLGILLYTIIACIFTGIVAPLLWIRNTFISGAVNMFQIGFRSLRRTFLACILDLQYRLRYSHPFQPVRI